MQQLDEKDGGDGINRPPDALLRAESHRLDAWRFSVTTQWLKPAGSPVIHDGLLG